MCAYRSLYKAGDGRHELLLDCVAVSVFDRHVPDLHHLAYTAHLAQNL